MGDSADTLPTSEHFVVEQIAAGVYAAIAREGGAAFSNAGIVDLGDRTLIFDSFETPRAAEDLQLMAEQLTGRPASYVVNSHFHPDHWFGNQVFADRATLIATPETRDRMFEVAAQVGQYKKEPATLRAIIREDEARLETEVDERRRSALLLTIARWRYALDSLPTLDFRFPDQTFDQRLVFHGSERTAELICKGGGHTASDAFLVLPADKVLFMGDLGFFQREPFMTDCDPQAWLLQLDAMEGADIEIFVPGHGPLGAKPDIAAQKQYMIMLQALVAHILQHGGSLEEVMEQPLPSPFDHWSTEGTPLASNVRVLFEHLTG